MEYLAILTPDEDMIQVTFPDLPNVIVCGIDGEDAKRRAAEAVESYLEVLAERGIPAPMPTAKVVTVEAA